jgi:hypothetical protein
MEEGVVMEEKRIKLNINRFASSGEEEETIQYSVPTRININPDIKIKNLSLKDIDEKVNNLFNLIFPIGSVYKTTDSTFDPNNYFNGTWTAISEDTIVAWAEMSGTTVNASKNISSITTTDSGSTFIVKFSKTMANTKYKPFISIEVNGISAEIVGVYNKTISQFYFDCSGINGLTKPSSQNLVVIGQLATPEYYEWKRIS